MNIWKEEVERTCCATIKTGIVWNQEQTTKIGTQRKTPKTRGRTRTLLTQRQTPKNRTQAKGCKDWNSSVYDNGINEEHTRGKWQFTTWDKSNAKIRYKWDKIKSTRDFLIAENKFTWDYFIAEIDTMRDRLKDEFNAEIGYIWERMKFVWDEFNRYNGYL